MTSRPAGQRSRSRLAARVGRADSTLSRYLLVTGLVAGTAAFAGCAAARTDRCVPGAQLACACLDGTGGVQTCDSAGTLNACLCDQTVAAHAGLDDGGTNPSAGADLMGTATLVGQTDWSGTTVSVDGTTLSTTTANDGTWTLPHAPLGWISLSFSNGDYHATLPTVLSLPGGNGGIFEGTWSPLTPLDVPLGQRLSAGTIIEPSADAGTSQSPLQAIVTQFPDPGTGEPVQEVISTTTGSGFMLETGALIDQVTANGAGILYQLSTESSPGLTLKTVSPAGGPPVMLTTGAEGEVALTPDGTLALYIARNPQSSAQLDLLAQPLGGGTAVTLLTVPAADGLDYEVTPDSSSVVVCSKGVFQKASTDGSASAVTLFSQGGCGSFLIAPDGKHVVTFGETNTCYAAPLEPDATPVALPGTEAVPLGFSPDGHYVVMANQEMGAQLATLDGATTIPISDGYWSYTFFLFTADSQYMVWTEPYGETPLERLSISTGLTTTILPSPDPNVRPVLSADGHTVFAVQENALYAVDVPSGAMTTLVTNANLSLFNDSSSPDGSLIAFFDNGTLTVAPADGMTAPTPLFNDGIPQPMPGYAINNSNHFWIDNSHLAVVRHGTPPPYGVLDGVYMVPVNPTQ